MKMYVAGKWRDSDRKTEVLNPYDGKVIDSVPRAGLADLEEAISNSRSGADAMARVSAYERARILRASAGLLEASAEQFARTLASEVGKTIREARGEVARSIETLTLSSEEAKRIHGETVPFDAGPVPVNKVGFYLRVPVGVVAAISPFNFPLNLVLHKVGPAIAAGNAVILKPASATPLVALLLTELLLEAGLPPAAISTITGPGGEIGDALVVDSRIDMVTFTGSLDVGRRIAARRGLGKLTMELGSNSACILMDDADLERAVPKLVRGGYALAGQVCISVQRVYVHEAIYDEFVERFVAGVRSIRVGDPLDEATDMGPMITEDAARRALEWVDEAVDGGATIATGGAREGALFEPTVLTDVAPDAKISCEEAFAPVVVVNRVRSLDEAIASVNDSKYGLQSGIFTRDIRGAFEAARRIETGGVMINEVPTYRLDAMPYGGVKMSGLGREGPRFAVEEMTEMRVVCFDLD
jgi:glyceraldehyde-3-phosphate dehydrogenase (NADP+)